MSINENKKKTKTTSTKVKKTNNKVSDTNVNEVDDTIINDTIINDTINNTDKIEITNIEQQQKTLSKQDDIIYNIINNHTFKIMYHNKIVGSNADNIRILSDKIEINNVLYIKKQLKFIIK